jgi:hypothetical protein
MGQENLPEDVPGIPGYEERREGAAELIEERGWAPILVEHAAVGVFEDSLPIVSP